MRTAEEHAIASAIIELMRGVVYREQHEDSWGTLDRSAGPVRDHFAAIGVDVVVDDTEGYAYLRSQDEEDTPDPLPRLVKRAQPHLQRQPAARPAPEAAGGVRDHRR